MLDDKAEQGTFSEADVLKRKEFFEEFWKLSRMKESFTYQKSRLHWLKVGDSNSAFFHACVNRRSRENAIHRLPFNGGWIEEPDVVKLVIHNHFEKLFT